MYQDGAKVMGDDKVRQILSELEESLRSGGYQYRPRGLTDRQGRLIKEVWAPEMRQKLRGELSVRDSRPNRAELLDVVWGIIKDNALSRVRDGIYRNSRIATSSAAAEVALSCFLDEAPDPVCPMYKECGEHRIGYRVMGRVSRLVINEDEARSDDAPSAYVCILLDKTIGTPLLMGWSSIEDIRTSPCGSRDTDDSLSWRTPAFYVTPDRFRPIKDLCSELGLTELPEGLVLEGVPEPRSVPQSSNLDLSMLQTEGADDFYDVIEGKSDKHVV
jgi:hypothetical protein